MEFIFGVMMIAAMIILKKRLPIIRGKSVFAITVENGFPR